MPFTQPGSTTAVEGERVWIITDGMLHVLKIYFQDQVPYFSLVLVLVLNEGIQISTAYMHPDNPPSPPPPTHTHACARMDLIRAFDLTEIHETDF